MTRAGRQGSVRTRDRGMERIERNAPKLGGMGVKVGILATAPNPPDSDINLAGIASVHEYGSDNTPAPIPERSFLRSSLEEKRDEIAARMQAGALAVEAGANPATELARIGAWFQGVVQAKITDGPFVPLAESTIEAKQSSVALIDTGRMRQAVAFEVVTDAP